MRRVDGARGAIAWPTSSRRMCRPIALGSSVVVSARDVDSDGALVVAAQMGDRDAFAELFRRHYGGVRRSCARRLGDLREADEVAQAAFVRAWERIDRCEGERRFGGWVQVIAHNLCIDTVRDRGRISLSESPAEEARASSSGNPEDALLRVEAASLVQLALNDLPQRQRDVVVARHLEDRRPGEIAAALGLSVGAVDSLLLRGRRRLAAAVERLSSDRGAISASSASSVAAGVAGTSGRFVAAVQSVQGAIGRASYHVAVSLGMVPGVAGPTQRAAAAVLVTAAAAAGAAVPAAAPAQSPAALPIISVAAPALPPSPGVQASGATAIPAALPAASALVVAVPGVPAVPVAPPAPAVAPAPVPALGSVVNNTLTGTITLLDRLGAVLDR